MVTRRGFLGALAAGFAAPAIVRSESLMKLITPKREIALVNPLHFDTMSWRPEPSDQAVINEAYNLAVARQDWFGETLWPAVVISPDMAGIQSSKDFMFNRAGILVRKPGVFQ